MRADSIYPGFKGQNAKWYPDDMIIAPPTSGEYLFVDGDKSADGGGKSWEDAYNDIQSAVTAASDHDVIFIKAKTMSSAGTDTDPDPYAETIIIPAGKDGLRLIGVGSGRTLGGLPQIKIGAGSTAMLSIRSAGVGVYNLNFNGASSSGGGILLDESTSSYQAFGVTISNCHFKNCRGSGASSTGGAIYTHSNGGSWDLLVENSIFYNNRAGIVLVGTSSSRPQDWTIRNCEFYSNAATTVDADIDVGNGSGVDGLIIRDCVFGTVDVPQWSGTGSLNRYLDLTGCEGILANSQFACIVGEGETEKTFGASGDAAIIPTTVRIAGCTGETSTTGASVDFGMVFRT